MVLGAFEAKTFDLDAHRIGSDGAALEDRRDGDHLGLGAGQPGGRLALRHDAAGLGGPGEVLGIGGPAQGGSRTDNHRQQPASPAGIGAWARKAKHWCYISLRILTVRIGAETLSRQS